MLDNNMKGKTLLTVLIIFTPLLLLFTLGRTDPCPPGNPADDPLTECEPLSVKETAPGVFREEQGRHRNPFQKSVNEDLITTTNSDGVPMQEFGAETTSGEPEATTSDEPSPSSSPYP